MYDLFLSFLIAKKKNTCPPPEEKGEPGFRQKFEVPKVLKVRSWIFCSTDGYR
ncbi:MAG: hypothetical protein WD530_00065 [Vicingaceae bacterium]